MITELKFILNVEDCEKILNDLEGFFKSTNGLSPESYLFYNKIRGFVCAYSDDLEKIIKENPNIVREYGEYRKTQIKNCLNLSEKFLTWYNHIR